MPLRRLTDTPLHVRASLVGSLLGSPARRIIAFAVDATLLVVPAVLTSLAIAGLFLWTSDRPAFDALRRLAQGGLERSATHRVLRDLAPLLVRLECRGLPAEAILATEQGDVDRAADVLADYDFQVSLKISEGEYEAPPGPKSVRIAVEKLIPPLARGLALFVVPAAYFTLFTCSRLRATPGKLLLGLRVVRLDGEDLSLVEGLERFVGYLHIPATLFVSLLDFWRDPNSRLPHDRTVHTAVLRAQRRRAAPAARATAKG
jgi:hypothetical protein